MGFPTENLGDIWDEPNGRVPRLFISHKADDKQLAMGIKAGLRLSHGIASFVAHEDIEPSMEWLGVIERALHSMDGPITLLTPEFRDSQWTDQEIGFALGRGVPVISVHLGKAPYGFIGKFQAILGGNKTPSAISDELAKAFFKSNGVNEELRINAYLGIISDAGSFDTANGLFTHLSEFENLSPEQEQRLVDIFNTNSQVRGSWKSRGGIVRELKRMTGYDYEITAQGTLDDGLPW